MTVNLIRSGGQTGADRAALDAALALGIPCTGWCPAGRRAEDGVIPSIYPLQETPSRAYAQRTAWNVRDSEGTLVLSPGPPAGGTAWTVRLARRLSKPLLVIDPRSPESAEEIRFWLNLNNIRKLNVAGPREGESPGIYELTLKLLKEVCLG